MSTITRPAPVTRWIVYAGTRRDTSPGAEAPTVARIGDFGAEGAAFDVAARCIETGGADWAEIARAAVVAPGVTSEIVVTFLTRRDCAALAGRRRALPAGRRALPGRPAVVTVH